LVCFHAEIIVHVFFSIPIGDLTRQKVEAVVSPANARLWNSGGAAKCIADAAGLELEDECKAYIKKHGPLTVAVPMHTTAGHLPAPISHVIHVTGPALKDGDSNFDEAYKLLTETFYNCLVYADKVLSVSSVAIPAVSSGMTCVVFCGDFPSSR
jgi:O-acetyl-ADP-ribose deacetylase (regulator of RNase III)